MIPSIARNVPGFADQDYNAITGAGNDVTSSDASYHWGALLGVITLLEGGR